MAFWRWLSVLLLLTSAHAAAKADDLAKLKASLAERFASYSLLHCEYTVTGPDPLDYSKSIGSQCLWEKATNRERLDITFSSEDGSRVVMIFDGTRTTSIGHPGPQRNLAPNAIRNSGSARISAGGFSSMESGINLAAAILGVGTLETRSSFLQILDDQLPNALSPSELNGHRCLSWSVRGTLPDGGTYTGQLTVDVEAGWLPVAWQVESTVPGEKKSITTQRVITTEIVVDERSGDQMTMPKTGEFSFRTEGDGEVPPRIIQFQQITLGRPFSNDRFRADIPDGYRVTNEMSQSSLRKEYISGGPEAEKKYLAEITAQVSAMQSSQPVKVFNASIPEGTGWSIWLIVGSAVLAIGSLYARRL